MNEVNIKFPIPLEVEARYEPSRSLMGCKNILLVLVIFKQKSPVLTGLIQGENTIKHLIVQPV